VVVVVLAKRMEDALHQMKDKDADLMTAEPVVLLFMPDFVRNAPVIRIHITLVCCSKKNLTLPANSDLQEGFYYLVRIIIPSLHKFPVSLIPSTTILSFPTLSEV